MFRVSGEIPLDRLAGFLRRIRKVPAEDTKAEKGSQNAQEGLGRC
jgi:hypothetical protein